MKNGMCQTLLLQLGDVYISLCHIVRNLTLYYQYTCKLFSVVLYLNALTTRTIHDPTNHLPWGIEMELSKQKCRYLLYLCELVNNHNNMIPMQRKVQNFLGVPLPLRREFIYMPPLTYLCIYMGY